jgi:RNA polymerase sporulation-specific sigma factor
VDGARAATLHARARAGDAGAREALLQANLGLVSHVARRFLGSGLEPEDLHQIGCIGLLKAIDRFEPQRGLRFSTYACPLILGEIQRFLRDHGPVAMPRQGRALARQALRLAEREAAATGREPPVGELAARLGCDPADLAAAMEAVRRPASLDAPAGGELPPLGLRLPAGDGEAAWDRLLLHDLLRRLPARERKVIVLRYLLDRTQAEVAAEIGVSQVHVSRIERAALRRLREAAGAPSEAHPAGERHGVEARPGTRSRRGSGVRRRSGRRPGAGS